MVVLPIVLGFNDGTQVFCQVYSDKGDGHAASPPWKSALLAGRWGSGL
jgi:hypothetical protein